MWDNLDLPTLEQSRHRKGGPGRIASMQSRGDDEIDPLFNLEPALESTDSQSMRKSPDKNAADSSAFRKRKTAELAAREEENQANVRKPLKLSLSKGLPEKSRQPAVEPVFKPPTERYRISAKARRDTSSRLEFKSPMTYSNNNKRDLEETPTFQSRPVLHDKPRSTLNSSIRSEIAFSRGDLEGSQERRGSRGLPQEAPADMDSQTRRSSRLQRSHGVLDLGPSGVGDSLETSPEKVKRDDRDSFSSPSTPKRLRLGVGRRKNATSASAERMFVNPFDKWQGAEHENLDDIVSEDFVSFIANPAEVSDPSKSKCPTCDLEVETVALKKFLQGKRQSTKVFGEFCRFHKTQTASEEWLRRGYPDINWDGLEKRLETHLPGLEKVLLNRQSLFRDRQVELIRSKKATSMFQQLGSTDFDLLTPGYYGCRGADIMVDAISANLSRIISDMSEVDDVLNNCAGGVAGYVQTVLVPELATRLVMEDMGIDQATARDVLIDSVALGDLINS